MCVTVSLPQSNPEPSPRGLKRSRSPDDYSVHAVGDEHSEQDFCGCCSSTLTNAANENKPRKRGRPTKTPRTSGDYTYDQQNALPTPASQTSPGTIGTPRLKAEGGSVQPVATPTQSSPGQRSTPKSTLKALPTVRDHTSDQLGPGGDEYIAREYDEQGEKKVDELGYLQGGREYKLRTFTLPGRGEKLFMLATECARTLQYRDSYLLFNKNRSLFKIIASAPEKEELVQHDILPYSYRSRQIALVTARSMFRQFGSRVVKDGRRVRDDYWEAKARKQGFTEEDAAGEKRPGAARAREAAAAEALGNRNALQANYGNIVYATDTNYHQLQAPPIPAGLAVTMTQMPLMDAYEAKFRDVSRPRMDNVGPPYADIVRTSSEAEMVSQASHAAEYSKQVNAQGRFRKGIVEEYWHRPHEPQVSTPQQANAEPVATSQALQSPTYDNVDSTNHSSMPAPQQPSTQTQMNPPSFPHAQNPMQSPSRSHYHQSATPHLPRQPSQLSNQISPSAYGYSPLSSQQQQSWGQPPPQPQQSPAMSNRSYNALQQSPHMGQQQIPSPMPNSHSQSPHPQQHQLQQSQNYPQMSMQGMGGGQLVPPGGGLRAMGAYGGMGMPQQMYGQMNAAQYMQQQQQQQHHAGQQNIYGGQWQQGYQ